MAQFSGLANCYAARPIQTTKLICRCVLLRDTRCIRYTSWVLVCMRAISKQTYYNKIQRIFPYRISLRSAASFSDMPLVTNVVYIRKLNIHNEMSSLAPTTYLPSYPCASHVPRPASRTPSIPGNNRTELGNWFLKNARSLNR